MTVTELVALAAAITYADGRHECTDLDNFDPVECPPCIGCGHGDCMHDKSSPSVRHTPCTVATCDCARFMCGDECTWCDGEGHVEHERTGQTITCTKCYGNGVIA
ncbi:hypothetical protein [Kribbella deserti]|uniref:Uncharacterized protein n=1 Tax=Kribbella deserti TaxID=1926257 RepID=A0ABV6QNA9_9ACTN